MAWYDYVPIASEISGIAHGRPGEILAGPLGYAAFDKPGEDAAKNAANAQTAALDKAMAQLQQSAQSQYAGRMADLSKTMDFYGPGQRYLESIYGGAATGPQPLRPGMPTPPPATGVPPGFPPTSGKPTPPLDAFGTPRKGGF